MWGIWRRDEVLAKDTGYVAYSLTRARLFQPRLSGLWPIASVEKERTCRLQGRAYDCPDKSGSACKFQFLGAMVAGPV
jgi:hypothetical protein